MCVNSFETVAALEYVIYGEGREFFGNSEASERLAALECASLNHFKAREFVSFRESENFRYEFLPFAINLSESAGASEREIGYVHAEDYAVFYCRVNIRIEGGRRACAENSHNRKLSVVSRALNNLVVTCRYSRNVRSVNLSVVYGVVIAEVIRLV